MTRVYERRLGPLDARGIPEEREEPENALGACYGHAWRGLGSGRRWLADTVADEPVVTVSQRRLDPGVDPPGETPATRVLELLVGGWLEVDTEAGAACYVTSSAIDPEELVHPYLAAAAGVLCLRRGMECHHAGAFVADGGAWAVLGDREAGKSTLMAALSRRGLPVLTDELVAVADGLVQVGPRLVDLRRPTAEHLGVGEALPSVRPGGRWRVPLEPASPAPLAGWVHLAWGPETELRPLGLTERIGRVAALGVNRPAETVGLVSLPGFELVRPATLDSLEATLDLLCGISARRAERRAAV